jgi:ankyrin repeat protein
VPEEITAGNIIYSTRLYDIRSTHLHRFHVTYGTLEQLPVSPFALHHASGAGLEQAVVHLLSRNATHCITDDNGVQALYYAAQNGHAAICRILLKQRNASNHRGGYYGSALQTASAKGHEKVVQILLDRGADVNAQGGHYGSALQAASANGDEEVVQILLDRGADVDAQGGEFGDALWAASRRDYEKVVQMLIEKGAVDMNKTTD